MIESQVREIRVGSVDVYVWGRITEKNGEDVSAVTPEVRTVSPDGLVGDWVAADSVQHPTPDVIRVGMQVTPLTADVGWWEYEAKVVDAPETEIVAMGGFLVVP
jgi:hypothetical protein